jgi:hypothetical protein
MSAITRAPFDTEREARVFICGIETANNPAIKIEGLYRKNGRFFVQIIAPEAFSTIRVDPSRWTVRKG